MTEYVLDACALLALLHEEDGADIVENIIDDAAVGNVKVGMHKANLLEVYYDTLRTYGKDRASEMLIEVTQLPIKIVSDINDELFLEMGRLKSQYKVSFADTFALSTASVSGGTLLTADHHEMDKIERSEPEIKFRWIR
jgi:PIN domain nuclease of toxin-antitoxin system